MGIGDMGEPEVSELGELLATAEFAADVADGACAGVRDAFVGVGSDDSPQAASASPSRAANPARKATRRLTCLCNPTRSGTRLSANDSLLNGQ
jgi:hypothetical protein